MSHIRPKKRTTIYMEPSLHSKYKLLCAMEGVTMSQDLEAYVRHKIETHWPGNPQVSMTKFTEPTKLDESCEHPRCNKPAIYKDRATHGGTVLLCREHHEHALEEGLIKTSKPL